MSLLLSNNVNKQSPSMLSLEIFGYVCAAAADYWQIRYRPPIPAAASKTFKNEYNNTSQFSTNSFVFGKKFSYISFFIYI